MNELIARLKRATGPDRESDLLIYEALNQNVKRESWGCVRSSVEGGGTKVRRCPFYTGSLDDARTLILPECSFGGLSQVSPRDWIMLIFSRTDSKARWEGEAPTAELAICIAALEAHAALKTAQASESPK